VLYLQLGAWRSFTTFFSVTIRSIYSRTSTGLRSNSPEGLSLPSVPPRVLRRGRDYRYTDAGNHEPGKGRRDRQSKGHGTNPALCRNSILKSIRRHCWPAAMTSANTSTTATRTQSCCAPRGTMRVRLPVRTARFASRLSKSKSTASQRKVLTHVSQIGSRWKRGPRQGDQVFGAL